ncbi:MAG TPA: glutamate-cysteine ligase family protein [Jatrophihabitans sp.]|nr:glutamate-cysteine ligase family protein [Jatrophihabitans sp.]
MSHLLADPAAASPIRSVAEAREYVRGVCFKHGPPVRTGLELEWLLVDPDDPRRHPELGVLLAALGSHAPRSLNPDSPAAPLPGGGLVTIEPGGQVEISSAPHRRLDALISAMRTDEARLRQLLAPTGFVLSDRATETRRTPARVLRTPRYDAMAARFAERGPAGDLMMCASAATQVCLDLGEREEAPLRWRAAHMLGPVLLAAFANSPGSAAASERMAAWWALDPVRTLPPLSLEIADYPQRALRTPVLARRGGGSWLVEGEQTVASWLDTGRPLTTADLDLHLSMLFPPVRPQGYLELRYLDAQPAGQWLGPLVLLTALFAGPLQPVVEICLPVGARWQPATEIGLADPQLAAAAGQLAQLVPDALDRVPLTAADRELAQQLIDARLTAQVGPALEVAP